jgi:hypothetical protein
VLSCYLSELHWLDSSYLNGKRLLNKRILIAPIFEHFLNSFDGNHVKSYLDVWWSFVEKIDSIPSPLRLIKYIHFGLWWTKNNTLQTIGKMKRWNQHKNHGVQRWGNDLFWWTMQPQISLLKEVIGKQELCRPQSSWNNAGIVKSTRKSG